MRSGVTGDWCHHIFHGAASSGRHLTLQVETGLGSQAPSTSKEIHNIFFLLKIRFYLYYVSQLQKIIK